MFFLFASCIFLRPPICFAKSSLIKFRPYISESFDCAGTWFIQYYYASLLLLGAILKYYWVGLLVVSTLRSFICLLFSIHLIFKSFAWKLSKKLSLTVRSSIAATMTATCSLKNISSSVFFRQFLEMPQK